MNNIVESLEKYKKALAKIIENRTIWTETTKGLIYDTLLKINKADDLDWQVHKVERVTNREAVTIRFNKQASGLVEKSIGGIKNHIKHGGALTFSQGYNGKVFIVYTYPYVEDQVGQLKNKLIDRVEP